MLSLVKFSFEHLTQIIILKYTDIIPEHDDSYSLNIMVTRYVLTQKHFDFDNF